MGWVTVCPICFAFKESYLLQDQSEKENERHCRDCNVQSVPVVVTWA